MSWSGFRDVRRLGPTGWRPLETVRLVKSFPRSEGGKGCRNQASREVLLCRCRGGEKCHADVLMKLHDERDVL